MRKIVQSRETKGLILYFPVDAQQPAGEQAALNYYAAGQKHIAACINDHPTFPEVKGKELDLTIFAEYVLAAFQTQSKETSARSAAVFQVKFGSGSAAAGFVVHWVPAVGMGRGKQESNVELLVLVQAPMIWP